MEEIVLLSIIFIWFMVYFTSILNLETAEIPYFTWKHNLFLFINLARDTSWNEAA